MTDSQRRSFKTDFILCGGMTVVYLLLGWFYWRPVYTFAKPDEALHLVYVADVRRGNLWPSMTNETEPPFTGNQQRCQPPLYYWLAALISAPTPLVWPGTWVTENPFFLNGIPHANGARFIGAPEEMGVVFAARALSWLLGALVICAVYSMVRAWASPPVAALAAWMSATLPSVLFIQTAMSSITLAAPLNALILAQLSWAWQRGMSRARAGRLAILLPLAIWTRMETLVLLLPLALVLWREWRLRRLAARPVIILAAGALLTLPLFVRNMVIYAEPLASACLFRRDVPLSPAEWLANESYGFSRAVFVSLGEGFVFAPEWVYALMVAFLALGAFGWVRAALTRQPGVAGAGMLMLVHAAALVGVTINGSLVYISGGPRYIAMYGVSWIALWATGYAFLWPARWRRLGIGLGFVAWTALNVYIILGLMRPQYEPLRAQVDPAQPVAARFWGEGAGIMLRGIRVDPDQPQPGDRVTVHFVWEVTRPIARNLAVFVHATPDEFSLPITQQAGYPVNGNYPFTWWQTGDVFEDSVELALPQEPASYKLTMGLFNPATGVRAPAFDMIERRFANDAVVLRDVKAAP